MARNEDSKDEKMTVEEAGRRGGEATSETHDREYYERIGAEGGAASSGNSGSDNNSGNDSGTASDNPGNFANDRERASREGEKGGRSSGNQNS